ncbi:unnamed protein product [Euphydryas editha]|uniref:Uncharacterized protein n=1 Tax=Euphydryas editha TaxID=104508 RepID=A0AAU9TNU8_EUPED|nr:unnamed protein product [Euphydryas editha]
MDACVTCNRSLRRLRRHILSQRFFESRRDFVEHIMQDLQPPREDVYLTRLIAPYIPERRRHSKVEPSKRRNRLISTTYFLKDKGNKNRPVCKAMFMKTFSLKKDRLHDIAKTVFEGNIPKENRGGDRKSTVQQQYFPYVVFYLPIVFSAE